MFKIQNARLELQKAHVTILFLLASITINAQCDTDSLQVVAIAPSLTDAQLSSFNDDHQVYWNSDCTHLGKLLVHIVGTNDSPQNTQYFPSIAADNGYHVIVLSYPNTVSIPSSCRLDSDPLCFDNMRKEIVYGGNWSPHVNVNSANSIVNRLQKLVLYLNINWPNQNWGQFLTVGNDINWLLLTVSGHSQGAGHAAYLGVEQDLNRVIMFGGPNDYSEYFNDTPNWLDIPRATADSSYFGFINKYDGVIDYQEQLEHWNELNLSLFGDTVEVSSSYCPFEWSHQLYASEDFGNGGVNHGSMIRNLDTPLDPMQVPIYAPIWRYLLGINAQIGMADFSYTDSLLCGNGNVATPFIQGSSGGEFVSASAGLMLDTVSGQIDLQASDTGVYEIHYEFSGECLFSSSQTVEVFRPDTSIVATDFTVTSNGAGNYQWLDCINNFAPILNEMNAAYTPSANGWYAVEVELNGCIDTSACYPIAKLNTIENSLTKFTLYPIPTKDLLRINVPIQLDVVQFEVFDSAGRKIREFELYAGYNQIKLKLDAGGYYSRIIQNGRLIHEQIIQIY